MALENDFKKSAAPPPAPGALVAAIGVDSIGYWDDLKGDHAAIEKQYIEAVTDLLDRGADIDEKSPAEGRTALMWAARLGFTELARLLIDRGASLEERERDGKGITAFSWAVASCSAGVVRLLIEAGAERSLMSRNGSMGLVSMNETRPKQKELQRATEAIREMMANAPEIRQRALEEKNRKNQQATVMRKRKALQARAPKVTIRTADEG